MPVDPISQIQRTRPFGRLTPRIVYPLAFEKVRPVIRIAHRHASSMRIAERIIFDHEFVLLLAGEGEFSFGRQCIRFGPHDLFFISPFVPHAIIGERCESIAVHFDFTSSVPPACQALPRRASYEVRLPGGMQVPRHQKLPPHGRIEQEMLELVQSWSSGSELGKLTARACLMQALATLLRGCQDGTPRGDREREMDRLRMEKVLARLTGEAGQRIAVPEMAKLAGLSVSHFTRLFREWTGFPPVEYQRRQRVAHARELLADPTLAVKEVAARIGFDDPYHFSRVFRQVDGLSPLHYREAVLAGRRR